MGSLPRAFHPKRKPGRPSDRRPLNGRPRPAAIMPTELSREICEDEDGKHYAVIVWRLYPGLRSITYTLDSGALVNFVDERKFEVARTGLIITRLE